MKRLLSVLLLLVVGVVLGVVVAVRWASPVTGLLGQEPDVRSMAEANLQAVQAQNRLTAFAARFTVAVTSQQSRLGLTARKTMIVPGLVRYELDWSRLQPEDLHWDAAMRTLTVDIPDVMVSNPEIDMTRIREYSQGDILLTFTDAEAKLDAANRVKVREALLREAKTPILMTLARDATRAAVERTFQLPLGAAGVDAKVRVRLPGEAGAGS